MNTITVTNKEDFEKAVNEQADKIIITGDFAKSIISTQKKKNVSKKVGIGSLITGGLVLVAGVAAAPFTGGISAGAALAASASITAGAVTLSTAELVIAVCGVLGVLGISAGIINTISKNYDIKISVGSNSVECTRKK